MTKNCEFLKKCLFLDVQTTGGNPTFDQILEIGWHLDSNTQSHILETDVEIPQRILRMTGLTEAEIEKGQSPSKIKKKFLASCKAASMIVIHYAPFEKRFLSTWLEASGLPVLCTHQISKILLPGLRSYSLRSVASELGNYEVHDLKRSEDHVYATKNIFETIVRILSEKKVPLSLEQLQISRLKNLTMTKSSTQKKALDKKEQLRIKRLSSPPKSGVYFFKNSKGKVLYIGKAKNIKARLSSHFNGKKTKGSKNNELLSRVHDIHYELSETLLEAEILESDLIKKWNPPYNVQLKKEKRTVHYLKRNVSASVKKPTFRSIGPFSNLTTIHLLFDLYQNILNRKPRGKNARYSFQLMDQELGDFCEVEIFKNSTFNQLIGFATSNKRSFLANCLRLGRHRMHLNQLKAAEGLDELTVEELPMGADEEDEEIDLDQILDFILIDVYRNYEKAIQIKHLANATIAFKDNNQPGEFRVLKLSGGSIKKRAWTPSFSEQILEPGNPTKLPLDIADYDRLRIIWSFRRKHKTDFFIPKPSLD